MALTKYTPITETSKISPEISSKLVAWAIARQIQSGNSPEIINFEDIPEKTMRQMGISPKTVKLMTIPPRAMKQMRRIVLPKREQEIIDQRLDGIVPKIILK